MRSRRATAAALAGLLALGGPGLAPAAPAPWFVWRSLLDGREHCAQSPPGQGWERVRGPYRDLRCRLPQPPAGPPRAPAAIPAPSAR